MKVQARLSIITAFLESFFFLGIIFGFSSLQFVLKKEGYFEYLCDNKSDVGNNSIKTNHKNTTETVKDACNAQEASLNLVWTLSYSLLFLLAFPSGYLLDKCETWIYRTIMTTFYTLGLILLSVSTSNTSLLLYPGCMFIGIAGYGLHISNFQTANFLKPFRSSIMTMLNGLFDSSTVVLLLAKKGYDFGTDFLLILQIMTCLTVFIWLRTYLLLPRKIIPFPLPPEGINFGWSELKCCKEKNTRFKDSKPVSQNLVLDCNNSATDSRAKDVKKASFKESLTNVLLWTNVFHYSVITLRLSFVISSLLTWLRTFTDLDKISKLTDDFGIILLFGGLCAPINGLIIDGMRKFLKSKGKNNEISNLQTSFISLSLTSLLSIIMSIMALLLSAYGTFLFFLFTRSFVHGSNVSFLASNFSFKDFGKLYGLVTLSAGLSGLLQYAIFQLSLNFDPTFYYTNIGFLIATLLTLLHPIALAVKIAYVNARKTTEINHIIKNSNKNN